MKQHVPYGNPRAWKRAKRILGKKMAKNFVNKISNISWHIQAAQQNSNKTNFKRGTSRHMLIKLLKDKENPEAVREKWLVTYKVYLIR